ncbi:MAG: cysteine desulfurase [Oligoflexia bacterium]|nr:cysteine desulfurase [Oligoflexia bacterium]
MNSRVYLDYNATTPLHPLLKDFVYQNLDKFGNPSSVHGFGREAKKLISTARDNLSKYLNTHPLEIIFTASGSESNNQAILKSLPEVAGEKNEVLVSSVEHPSVMRTVESLVLRGYKIIKIPVSREGIIDLGFIKNNLNPKTALVTVQLVNNETGNIFPIKEISSLTHDVGALMHSDMVQALGKINIDLKELDVDLASLAAHKFYSLKGAAVLYVKSSTPIKNLILGGGQERGRRAGTENTLAIATFGEAIKLLTPLVEKENKRIELLRSALERELLSINKNFIINGAKSDRVANVINITCPLFDGETLLINLDVKGFSVSSGAACSSGTQEPSPILRAMGLSLTEAASSMRISLGWFTSESEVAEFLKAFRESILHLESIQAEAVNL